MPSRTFGYSRRAGSLLRVVMAFALAACQQSGGGTRATAAGPPARPAAAGKRRHRRQLRFRRRAGGAGLGWHRQRRWGHPTGWRGRQRRHRQRRQPGGHGWRLGGPGTAKDVSAADAPATRRGDAQRRVYRRAGAGRGRSDHHGGGPESHVPGPLAQGLQQRQGLAARVRPAPQRRRRHRFFRRDDQPVRRSLADRSVLILPLARPMGSGWDWRGNLPADLAFFDALITRVKSQLCIDNKRIFSLGFSGGGSFSGVLGCRRTDIRAIASAGGGQLLRCPGLRGQLPRPGSPSARAS